MVDVYSGSRKLTQYGEQYVTLSAPGGAPANTLDIEVETEEDNS